VHYLATQMRDGAMDSKEIIDLLSGEVDDKGKVEDPASPPTIMFKNPGDIIFDKGEAGAFMYVIRSGMVEIKERNIVLRTLGEGDIMGEMALIDDSPRSTTAKALTKCSLTPVDYRRFFRLIQKRPEFALHVMQILSHRLRTLTDRVST